MKKTLYNPEFDFSWYIQVASNVDKYKSKIAKKQQNKKAKQSKEHLEKQKEFYETCETFYYDLSFIQRNSLDLFFNKTDVIVDFMMFLIQSDQTILSMDVESFKTFLMKEYELEQLPENYEVLHDIVKKQDESPDQYNDIEKTVNIIFDILKDASILEVGIKPVVQALYKKFYSEKVEPKLPDIQKMLQEHHQMQADYGEDFIDQFFPNKSGPIEAKDSEMQPYLTVFTPFEFLISVGYKKYYYNADMSMYCCGQSDEDLFEPFLKFISDPKRYEMIKMLSKKKWYANELAKVFDITPATMSYHVNKMFQIGLIHLEQGEQNKMYMSLDKEKLEMMLEKIQKDILN